MFCTDRYCSRLDENASALDVTYMGTPHGDLPPQKATSGRQVASVYIQYQFDNMAFYSYQPCNGAILRRHKHAGLLQYMN